MKFVVYKDVNARWYWALRAEDGMAVAECAMGFSERSQAVRNAQEVRASASRALIFDPLGNLMNNEGDAPR